MKMFYELPMANISAEEILEKARIRQLAEYERYCCDNGHKEEQKSLWFEDGMIFTTWFKGRFLDYCTASPVKKKDIKKQEAANSGAQPIRSTRHKVNNTVVWLKGSRAVAELICSLDFRTELGSDWVDLSCQCRMHYRIEKREGRWGIVYFEGIYEKDRIDTVFGDSAFAIPRETLMKYRPNNWNMAARRDLYEGGSEYAEEWCGPDRPETIEKLYQESSRWIGMED